MWLSIGWQLGGGLANLFNSSQRKESQLESKFHFDSKLLNLLTSWICESYKFKVKDLLGKLTRRSVAMIGVALVAYSTVGWIRVEC